MNRFELWDKVARCRLPQHFRLLVALWRHYTTAFWTKLPLCHCFLEAVTVSPLWQKQWNAILLLRFYRYVTANFKTTSVTAAEQPWLISWECHFAWYHCTVTKQRILLHSKTASIQRVFPKQWLQCPECEGRNGEFRVSISARCCQCRRHV